MIVYKTKIGLVPFKPLAVMLGEFTNEKSFDIDSLFNHLDENKIVFAWEENDKEFVYEFDIDYEKDLTFEPVSHDPNEMEETPVYEWTDICVFNNELQARRTFHCSTELILFFGEEVGQAIIDYVEEKIN